MRTAVKLGLLLGLASGLVVGARVSASASQQVELDRTLQRVHGSVIMASDVRQAKALRLVPGADAGDAAVQAALENRLLILHEISRAALKEPASDAIAARRATWKSSWPPGTDTAALMTRAGMNDQSMDGWCRDELKIAEYLDQRFGQRTAGERDKLMADWLADLRRRANLK